jgi:hypothetical protein
MTVSGSAAAYMEKKYRNKAKMSEKEGGIHPAAQRAVMEESYQYQVR